MKGKAFGFVFSSSEIMGTMKYLSQLQQALTSRGKEVIVTRMPGGDQVSDRIRSIILEEGELNNEALASLLRAAAVQNRDAVVGPQVDAGKIVLCKCEAGIADYAAPFLTHTFFFDCGEENDDDLVKPYRIKSSAITWIKIDPENPNLEVELVLEKILEI